MIKIYLTLVSEDGLGLLVENNLAHKLKNPASPLLHALLSVFSHLLYGYHQKGKHRFPSVHLSSALLDGVDIWMGDHLDKIPCAVLYGKPGWRSGHQSRLPPLLQKILYVD